MARTLHHVKTATVFFVCFDVVVVTVVFDITQNYRMSDINIRCCAADQRRRACEIRYTYSSFLLLNSCGMGGLFGLCQKSAKRRNIFVNKNAWRAYFSNYYVELGKTTRDTVTTARAELKTGLSSDRVAN